MALTQPLPGVALAIALGALTAGVGACAAPAPPPCLASVDCAGSAVCQPSGRCAPLTLDAARRAARRVRLEPARSALGPGATARGESTRIEDGGAVLLGFGPLPDAPQVLAAELVVPLDPDLAGVAAPFTLRVARVRPFQRPGASGGAPAHRGSVAAVPASLPSPTARRVLSPGPARPIRIDVTALVAAARRAGVRELDLSLSVEAPRGGALRLAAVRHPDPERRPRLDVLVP